MRRLHLMELEDQPWFPAPARDGALAFLAFMMRLGPHGGLLAGLLEEALQRTGAERVVDLCSGGGGPILPALERLSRPVPVLLTDLYPNLAAMQRTASRSALVSFEGDPVDATRVGPERPGLRTMFNSFHHFAPPEAERILRGAVEARQPIAVFEIVERSALMMAVVLAMAALSFLLIPFMRPLRPSWLFCTYVVPLIPFTLWWDGWVSCLRVYSPAELEDLTARVGGGYRWEIRRFPVGPVRGTFLLGWPQ